jgi:hypothetical protein
MVGNKPATAKKFESIAQADVPKGRDGKHKQIILELLAAIDDLRAG